MTRAAKLLERLESSQLGGFPDDELIQPGMLVDFIKDLQDASNTADEAHESIIQITAIFKRLLNSSQMKAAKKLANMKKVTVGEMNSAIQSLNNAVDPSKVQSLVKKIQLLAGDIK